MVTPRNIRVCAFCSCDEHNIWFKDEINRYGPVSKLVNAPSSNEIFRPYLAKSECSSHSSGTRSPVQKEIISSPDAQSLPMHVGYFFRSSVNSVIDMDDFIWTHYLCLEWSKCTVKQHSSDNILLITASALSQVCHFCGHYGASISCCVQECKNVYHMPCVLLSKAFLNYKSMQMFCTDHLAVAKDQASCEKCETNDSFENLVSCASCHGNFHPNCNHVGMSVTGKKKLTYQCSNCQSCTLCGNNVNGELHVNCSSCGRSFDLNCIGMDGPQDEREQMTWLCRDCSGESHGKFPQQRKIHSRHSLDSPYSRQKEVSNPKMFPSPPSTVSYLQEQNLSKGRCTTCGEACIEKIKGQDIIQCKLCNKYAHAICDRVPAELIDALVEKNLFICKTCRHTKCQKRGSRVNMLQMKLWTTDVPRPWNSISDISNSNIPQRVSIMSSAVDQHTTPTYIQNERLLNEDTPTIASLMITEPQVWSRLKIIYSFEYNGK